jgi:hypothetical protein
MECSATEPLANSSLISIATSTSKGGVSRFSILCAFAMTELYWLYLIFWSHVINPVSVSVVDSKTGLHLQSGQIGSLVMTLDWSEVRLAIVLSMVVFVLATLIVNVGTEVFASAGKSKSGRLVAATI